MPATKSFEEQRAELRARVLAIVQANHANAGAPYEPIQHYTCDGCRAVLNCEWAYDDYNTDGDCLAEK